MLSLGGKMQLKESDKTMKPQKTVSERTNPLVPSTFLTSQHSKRAQHFASKYGTQRCKLLCHKPACNKIALYNCQNVSLRDNMLFSTVLISNRKKSAYGRMDTEYCRIQNYLVSFL